MQTVIVLSWEFTPSQGNGTIAAVALTSSFGGQNAYGSLVGDASTFLQLKAADIGPIPDANKMVLFEAVEMDFENSLLYSITYENDSVRIRKLRISGLFHRAERAPDDSTYTVLEDEVLTPEKLRIPRQLYEAWGVHGRTGRVLVWFLQRRELFGDAVMLWIKISKTDYSFTEGQWILSMRSSWMWEAGSLVPIRSAW